MEEMKMGTSEEKKTHKSDEEQYFPLTKSDTLSFLEDNRLAIRSKSGMVRIINLDLIIEICIRRFDSYV